jgi:hypothetical protein
MPSRSSLSSLSRSSLSHLRTFAFAFFALFRVLRDPTLFAFFALFRALRDPIPFAILLLLAACGAAPAPLREEQLVDGVVVGLEASASPPLNASQELIVTLADEDGRPIDGADVYLDLTMLAMPMGTNRPEAEPLGEGRYRARTAYTMTGDWEITVVADVAGAERRAVFRRTVSE